MPEYRVTFGSQYGGQDYGADPHPVGGYDFVHRDGWWTIVAPDYDAARSLVVGMLGSGWSNLVTPEEYNVWELFPRGEMLRLIHPAMSEQAVHLLTGDLPDIEDDTRGYVGGRLLVTVWGNGTGEVAWRELDDSHSRWGVPSKLEPAP